MKTRFGAAGAMAVVALAAVLANAFPRAHAASTLDFYFIDVEGGQSTLIVTPAGESLLVDTGYGGNDGRDARRIMAAVRAAGLTKIDYLLITHFHQDHDTGILDLAPQIPIGTFVDHGRPSDDAAKDADILRAYNAYAAIRAKGKHLDARPGDRIPLKGVDVVVVASAASTITAPIAGGGQANPGCPAAAPDPGEKLENPRSTGFHLRFGAFRFVDLGDLSGTPLFALLCPKNLLGPVDLYLLPHHGGDDVSHPAYAAAFAPRAAILNNGEGKGGGVKTFVMLHRIPGLDVWQLHRSANPAAQNFADERIANINTTTGWAIKVSASDDGGFTITNQRTGAVKTYPRPTR